MRKFTLLALSLVAMLPLAANAQRYLGVATSNWSGTNSIYLNPANLADSRHKFSVDLFSVNFGVDNNLATIKNFNDLVSGTDVRNALTFSSRDRFSIVAPYAEVRGPGFMVSLGHKHGIALTTRVRAFNQFDNFNQNLYRNLIDSSFKITGQTQFKADKFNWTAHLWSEIGLSYGGIIIDKKKHVVKGGITGRYLIGAGYMSAVSKNLDVNYSFQNNTSYLAFTNTDIHLAQGGIALGNDGSNTLTNNLFGSAGKGFGFDLGLAYEFRPKYQSYKYDMDGKTGLTDRGKNTYMLRVSAAVTDLGSIKYSSNNRQVNLTGNGTLVGTEMYNKKTYDEIKNYMASKGIKADSSTGNSTKVGLPTAMVVNVDYHAYKGLYVNLLYMGNVVDRTRHGNTIYNQFTLTPRFDIRALTFSVPVTYNMMTKSIKYGAAVRVGGFFFGSDDLTGLIGSNAYGANMYFGAYVPFNKKKPRDSDGDHVSNRKDKCKNEKGVWEMRGCPNPDKDGDGVLDKDDKCPDVAGSKTAAGCPDADLDGVADAEDRCPSEAGLPAMQGCPDRDKDGVADIDDACPDQAGLAQFKGCPDTDGDGIADNVDKCPNAAGPAANEGCPDTDNDGIADNLDKCPTVPGTVNNQGCPEVSVEVKKRLAFAATAIQFDLGKATIKKTSYKLLDEVVKILNDYPDYNMTIEGHTDNTGKAEKNMTLSTDRAAAVKGYFISKGIAAERLSSAGFGDTKPVASNKTAAGRAKNRRVAMDLKLKD